MPKAPYFFV